MVLGAVWLCVLFAPWRSKAEDDDPILAVSPGRPMARLFRASNAWLDDGSPRHLGYFWCLETRPGPLVIHALHWSGTAIEVALR